MSKMIPAAEAQTQFAALLDFAQREPVIISEGERPVAVIMSMRDFEEREALKLERLRREVQKGIDSLDQGRSAEGKTFMKALVDEMD